jgi:hypothetical protein
MEAIKEFIIAEATEIIILLLGSVLSYVAISVRKAINNICDTKTKKDIAFTAVTAVEQIYQSVKGDEKFIEAVKYLNTALASKGIVIDEEEGIFLIESAVHEMNKLKLDLATSYAAELDTTVDESPIVLYDFTTRTPEDKN